jgi:hypothetical protein
VASLPDLIDAYRQQFPDEATGLSDALAGDPRTSGWAVLCDGVERLLQLKDPASRAWWVPHTTLTAGVADARAATAQALAAQTGVQVDLGDNPALPFHITIDDDGTVRIYYCFDVKEGETVSPAAAERARWTPFDTVSNARLGEKLMSH